MAYTLKEDNSGDSYDVAAGVYSTWYLAQTFTASGSYALKKISIPLCETGTAPTLYIELWSTSATKPDSMLKSKEVTAELSAYPSHDWVDVIFDTAYNVTEGTLYAIVVRDSNAGDLDNRGRWWYDSTGSWGGGQLGWSNDGAESWNMYSSYDHLFKIYSESGPVKAKTPAPTSGATGMTLDYQAFTWVSGTDPPPDEEVYNVYWGTTSGNLSQIVEGGSSASMAAAYLIATVGAGLYNETYYWRVDTYWPSTEETAVGDEWSFSSIAFDPPLPTGVTLTGGDGGEGTPTGTPTGLNNMITVRRLVAAARNKIFYET